MERRCKGGKERKGSNKLSKSLQANSLPNRGSTDGVYLFLQLLCFFCLDLMVMSTFIPFTEYYKYHSLNSGAKQGKASPAINEEIYAGQIQELYHKVLINWTIILNTYFLI